MVGYISNSCEDSEVSFCELSDPFAHTRAHRSVHETYKNWALPIEEIQLKG
jgi:hypothetical protein